ncbi:MAG: aminotransferase class I/II-fold pyridoxal phosphate-dependent enzyme [Lachnospiraceae bacterium]|nr:aminotransferase class I/II-fold pyridoxal phosphate-dependent enzyme [Lachnospiraceae bacterium]GFI02154.1 putative aminotransferase/MSMEI_6121 [Lachnospiraceae bacterium]
MKAYKELSENELLALKEDLNKQYEEAKAKGLKLDMSRGKPSPSQLDMERDFLEVIRSDTNLKTTSGVDCRNYGLLDGIPEAKKLMADMIGVAQDKIIVFGNSSLNIMYDTVARSMLFGVLGSTPWCKLDKVKFLCPVPGYDRHFAITEQFGIEMINVPMTCDGPDMDLVEKYVNEDPAVKGIWCVPKYSNPQGYTYSNETVKRFASLKPAAEDFRIYWDNAYAIHDLYEDKNDQLLEILGECEKAGNADMVYEFVSTSKVTFPGSGISALASSKANLDSIKDTMTIQTIGPDKLNQLRHVLYFKNIDGMKAHMMKHAAIMRPKFEAIEEVLSKELDGLEIGSWTKPNGGYFISFEAMEGCAKEIVSKCKEAGVVLTGAGATYPYKKDPKDSNIRIAPTFPSEEELSIATDLFVLCVKLVSAEKLLKSK